jgi:hypothetical protein
LGTRRFSLDPTTSQLRLIPGNTFSGLQGFLDLTVGEPDAVTGLATVDISDASTFISINLGLFNLCIRPEVPIAAAGILACNGGIDLGVTSSQDHNIGEVDVDGFNAADCTTAGGEVEQGDDPHPAVCNGPVTVGPSNVLDSGAGALLLAPDGNFNTVGIPAEVSIAPGPCESHPPGDPTVFGFVSGLSRAEIFDADDQSGNLFAHDEVGENFDCDDWMQENGPGRLVLSVPAVHGGTDQDLITVFVLDD